VWRPSKAWPTPSFTSAFRLSALALGLSCHISDPLIQLVEEPGAVPGRKGRGAAEEWGQGFTLEYLISGCIINLSWLDREGTFLSQRQPRIAATGRRRSPLTSAFITPSLAGSSRGENEAQE